MAYVETRKEARAVTRVPSCTCCPRIFPRFEANDDLQEASVVAGCYRVAEVLFNAQCAMGVGVEKWKRGYGDGGGADFWELSQPAPSSATKRGGTSMSG